MLTHDITERRKAEENNRRLTLAIDQSAESILFTDLNGTIIYVNQGFEKLSGYSRQEAVGENVRLVKSGCHPESFYRELWATLTAGKNLEWPLQQ